MDFGENVVGFVRLDDYATGFKDVVVKAIIVEADCAVVAVNEFLKIREFVFAEAICRE